MQTAVSYVHVGRLWHRSGVQYSATPDNEAVNEHLRMLHRRNITSKETIWQLLQKDLGVTMRSVNSIILCGSSLTADFKMITQRKHKLGLKGSSATTKSIPDVVKRQMVLDQMAKDPTGMQGPRTVKEGIAHDTGKNITWYIAVILWSLTVLDIYFSDWIWNEMQELDPGAFASRAPTAKKIHRVPIVAMGPHHWWSADGHEKLNKIRFPVWAIWDVWSGKWLGIWVVLDNCLKMVIAHLYLKLIKEMGG
jgi:hypothetical protein